MTSEILRAKVETPMSKNNPSEVKVEHIPLPPKELWKDLDNSASSVAPTAMPVATPAVDPAPVSAPVSFLGTTREVVVPLQFPFEHEGRQVSEITIRRLTLGEVQNLLQVYSGSKLSLVDVTAHMIGLPVEVLRSFDDDDGNAIIDRAHDFLPRRFREEDE